MEPIKYHLTLGVSRKKSALGENLRIFTTAVKKYWYSGQSVVKSGMANMEKRDFDKAASSWDEDPRRVKLAHEVADAIIKEVCPTKDMDVLDFGCGTGLVMLRIQPYVRNITGADSSAGMLSVLEDKIARLGLDNVSTLLVDFEKGEKISGRYHLIVSSMTLHHVPETAPLLRRLFELLHPAGILCLADLDTEDGTFHPDNTGVFHFGFDRARLKTMLLQTGFKEAKDVTAAVMERVSGTGGKRAYPVFLITARK